MTFRRIAAPALAAAALAAAAVPAFAPAAHAQDAGTKTVNASGTLDCRVSSSANNGVASTTPFALDVTSPEKVQTGKEYTVTVTPKQVSLPAKLSGGAAQSAQRIKLDLQLPEGVEFISGNATGGAGLTGDAPTLEAKEGGVVTLSGGGKVLTREASGKTEGGLKAAVDANGNATFTYPTMTLKLRATTEGNKALTLRANDTAAGTQYGVNGAVTYMPYRGGAGLGLCATDAGLQKALTATAASGEAVEPTNPVTPSKPAQCTYLENPSLGSAAKILDLTGLTRPLRTIGLGLGSLAQITLPVPGSSDLLTSGSLGEGVEIPIGSLGSAGTNGGSLGSEGQALKLNGQSVGDTFCNAVDGVGLDAIGGEVPALGSAMNPNGSLESASAGIGSGGK